MSTISSISRQTRPGRDQTIRLTRRGRMVVVLVTLVVALVAFSLGRVTSSASAGDAMSAPVAVAPAAYAGEPPDQPGAVAAAQSGRTVVRANETLWQVARRVAPDADPRAVVDDLMRRNHLSGSSVRAGQVLRTTASRSAGDTPGAREDTPDDLQG